MSSTAHSSPMHQFDEPMTDLINNFVKSRLSMDETPLDFEGVKAEVEAAIAGLISPSGHSAEHVLGIYEHSLAPTVLSADSPRFLSFIPAAPTKASLLFDTVVSCASLQGMSWLEAAGAIAAENQVLRWIADEVGMPAEAGGTFVSGGSAANLSALTVAREVGRERTGSRRVRIALSEQAHSSIGSSLKILDVDPVFIETDNHRVTGESLRRTLEKYDGEEPIVAVVVTSGTTNAGLVDDIAGVSAVAQENNLWLHVDGAYGGAGVLSPLTRDLYRGIEQADSFITDPHKWWFSPFDCAALLYKDPRKAVEVHTQDASYLDVLHDGLPLDRFNPTDVAYHLTRRARGLAMWFSVSVYGTDAYRNAVTSSIALARECAAYIKEQPQLELIMEPMLSVVLWRRVGWQAADYADLQERLLRDQIGFVTPTKWQGETVGRFAFLHPDTTMHMVEEILAYTK